MKRLLYILGLGLLFCATFAVSAKQTGKVSDEDRRKAAYVYMDALSANMDENYNLYAQLIDRAYTLDPEDPDIRMDMGEWMLLCANPNDTAALDSAFNLLFSGYYPNRDNYFEGTRMLNLSSKYRRWDDNLRVAEIMAERFPNRNEVQLALGQIYLLKASLGDTAYTPRALDVFTRLEERVGKSYDLSELKIRSYAVTNDTTAIVNELIGLNASSPDDPLTTLAIGQFYKSIGKPDSAIAYFNHACELDSTFGPAIMLRARFLEEQGDSTAFEREVMRAIKSPDIEFESKANFIVSYIRNYLNGSTREERIDDMFQTLIDVNSGEPDVYRLYGEYLAHLGKFDQAAEQMEYVVSLTPLDKANWLYLAQLNIEQKDYLKAAGALERASKYFPDDAMMVRVEAVYLSLADETKKAITVLENFPDSTITDHELRSDMLATLGDLYYSDGRKADAFGIYERSLKINPYNYSALNNVAYFYAENDTLLDLAEDYARRVVRHNPDNMTFIDTYAWVLYKKGDYEAAREQINMALAMYDANKLMNSIDNDLAIDMPAEEDKIETIDKIIDEDDRYTPSAEVYDHAGDINFRCGDIDLAVQLWEKALGLNPDNADLIKNKIKHRKIIDP